MGETRRKFDADFREGAVRLVCEIGKPIAQVARDLGINEGTLGNWVALDRQRREDGGGGLSEDERADRIDHDQILAQIGTFPARELVVKWLKSGVAEKGWLTPTEEGTPQGGVASPVLMLLCLSRGSDDISVAAVLGLRSGCSDRVIAGLRTRQGWAARGGARKLLLGHAQQVR